MKKHLEDFIYRRVKDPKEHEVKEILSIFGEKRFDKAEQFKKRDTVIKNWVF